MKSLIISTTLAALLASPLVAGAHDPKQHAQSKAEAVDEAAKPVIAVVEKFSAALQSADFKIVADLLADDVLILESGGAERSREEYLGHHAVQDAQFLKNARGEVRRRTARVDGPFAWIGTESELHASHDGKAMTLLNTETMVLRQTRDGWRIVHIHWSSRTRKEQ